MFKKFFNELLGNNDDQHKKNDEAAKNVTQQYAREEHEEEEEYDEEEVDDDEAFMREEKVRSESYEYDPITLHGTHYTKEAFDAEVQRRLKEELDNEDEPLSENDKRNWKREITRQLYMEWNGYNQDQVTKFEMANSMELFGTASSGFSQQINEDNNPLYAPIHGISLYDYAGICHFMSKNIPQEKILEAMGIDKAVWEEVNLLWPERMKEDGSFGVSVKFGEYFNTGSQHPKLVGLQAATAGDNPNLDRLKTDQYFYEELCGARTAAYEYGLDGAQWILENYGITLGDFQSVAMQWATEQQQNFDTKKIIALNNYQQEKQKEYAAKFAAEQGGNVADDIEF